MCHRLFGTYQFSITTNINAKKLELMGRPHHSPKINQFPDSFCSDKRIVMNWRRLPGRRCCFWRIFYKSSLILYQRGLSRRSTRMKSLQQQNNIQEKQFLQSNNPVEVGVLWRGTKIK